MFTLRSSIKVKNYSCGTSSWQKKKHGKKNGNNRPPNDLNPDSTNFAFTLDNTTKTSKVGFKFIDSVTNNSTWGFANQ